MKWLESIKFLFWVMLVAGLMVLMINLYNWNVDRKVQDQELIHQRFIKTLSHARTTHDSINIMLHFDLVD